MKKICIWCGKNHTKRPQTCAEYDKLVKAVIDKAGKEALRTWSRYERLLIESKVFRK